MAIKKSFEVLPIQDQIIEKYIQDDESITFYTKEHSYLMYHEQDCCERVTLEEIIGDLDDLLNTPLLKAEVRTNNLSPKPRENDSTLWTFYEFATIKGSVTLRWFGSSNGYYSVKVKFRQLT